MNLTKNFQDCNGDALVTCEDYTMIHKVCSSPSLSHGEPLDGLLEEYLFPDSLTILPNSHLPQEIPFQPIFLTYIILKHSLFRMEAGTVAPPWLVQTFGTFSKHARTQSLAEDSISDVK